ncbi:hypothetical protein WN982_30750 [Paraburkholderia sp. IMGN_8]|uniref:hypothetical protein n=1 Tax=Paraburkholderia sp. IMGN_8 TaxID=3136564 RepID=UPI00310166FB
MQPAEIAQERWADREAVTRCAVDSRRSVSSRIASPQPPAIIGFDGWVGLDEMCLSLEVPARADAPAVPSLHGFGNRRRNREEARREYLCDGPSSIVTAKM